MTDDLGGGQGNGGDRPERRPRGQDRRRGEPVSPPLLLPPFSGIGTMRETPPESARATWPRINP